MIRALLIDLDNTLVDRDAAFLGWLTHVLPREAMDQRDRLAAMDRGGYGDKRALFSAVGALLGVSAARARKMHDDLLPQFVSQVPAVAARLAGFRGPRVLVSNGKSSLQRAKLHAAGLSALFDVVLISEECGAAKPDPAVYRLALARARVSAEHALMVGDHPIHDIAAARSVGIAVRWCRTRWFEAPVGVDAVDDVQEVAW